MEISRCSPWQFVVPPRLPTATADRNDPIVVFGLRPMDRNVSVEFRSSTTYVPTSSLWETFATARSQARRRRDVQGRSIASPLVYRELAVAPELSKVVRCAWERTDESKQREIVVLPDGCVDIVWRADGRLFIAGPDLGPVVHPHPHGLHFTGLRLAPGAAATVLGVAADELRDRQVALDDLWGIEAERLADRLDANPADSHRLLAHAVADRLARGSLDAEILRAAKTLERGGMRVAEVADAVGLSDRHLYRRFVQQVGYGPTTFARVMRFRRFLRLCDTDGRGRTLATLAHRAGYADQAHLTRECRRISGRTPLEIVSAA
jgi:AraC-like DNA-binding protein